MGYNRFTEDMAMVRNNWRGRIHVITLSSGLRFHGDDDELECLAVPGFSLNTIKAFHIFSQKEPL